MYTARWRQTHTYGAVCCVHVQMELWICEEQKKIQNLSSDSFFKQMTSLPFKSTHTDQVRLNLIHYNLWTKVEVHNDYILSGLPPTKLVSTDNESKREWIVCKRLDKESRLKVKEINSWFEEIKQFTSGKGDQEVDNDTDDGSTKNGKSNDDKSPSLNEPFPVDNDNPIWKPIDKTMNGKGRVGRLTIALINDDGTIVYYFIHDGITKPRQN